MPGRISYTQEEIQNKLRQDITHVKTLYKHPAVSYTGETSGVPYCEIAAKFISENANLDNIGMISRHTGYNEGTRTGKFQETPDNTNDEEIVAMYMVGKTYLTIGKVIDYQVPLKDPKGNRQDTPERKENNRGVGKIDLISYNQETKFAYLLELKKEDNTDDTLLRALLEIYTYWKQLDHTIFRNTYNMPKTAPIIPAILIFKDSLQYKQCDRKKYPETNKLIDRLGVPIFVAEESEPRTYIITKLER